MNKRVIPCRICGTPVLEVGSSVKSTKTIPFYVILTNDWDLIYQGTDLESMLGDLDDTQLVLEIHEGKAKVICQMDYLEQQDLEPSSEESLDEDHKILPTEPTSPMGEESLDDLFDIAENKLKIERG